MSVLRGVVDGSLADGGVVEGSVADGGVIAWAAAPSPREKEPEEVGRVARFFSGQTIPAGVLHLATDSKNSLAEFTRICPHAGLILLKKESPHLSRSDLWGLFNKALSVHI